MRLVRMRTPLRLGLGVYARRALSSRPGSTAKDNDWSHSEQRTEQLRRFEKVGVGVFIATAPVVYGLFWYFGLLDSVSKDKKPPTQLSPRDEAQRRLAYEQRAAPLPPDGTPAFVPSDGFEGARPGFVFKAGDSGLGYYWEGER